MARTDPAERQRLASAAHEAVRGRVVPVDEKRRRARTNQFRRLHASAAEHRLAELLVERGIDVQQQAAVMHYNCDIVIGGDIAVEVWGGNWHLSPYHTRKRRQKFRDLLDAGFGILCVVVNPSMGYPLSEAVADEVIAHVEILRRQPPGRREYRVIWGASQDTFIGSPDDQQFTVKWPRARARDRRTGRYAGIPREAVGM
jgi:hypothetical protein